MINATCTWGDGPDVMLTFDDYIFVLYEDPKHQAPPHGDYAYGYVTKGSTDLTADEALILAAHLTDAANNAKELDRMCEEHDERVPQITKEADTPLTEEEMKAINEDYPIETLTCHKCNQRDTCKYVDDLYNTHGDCLADK